MRMSPFPLSSRAKPRDLQFRGPLLETPNSMLKQNCHLDRSAAQWRDLRFSFSSHADSEALMSPRAVWYGCPSFIRVTLELAAISTAADQQNQPDSVAKLASKQSASVSRREA